MHLLDFRRNFILWSKKERVANSVPVYICILGNKTAWSENAKIQKQNKKMVRGLFSSKKIYIHFNDTEKEIMFSNVNLLEKEGGWNLFPYFQQGELAF